MSCALGGTAIKYNQYYVVFLSFYYVIMSTIAKRSSNKRRESSTPKANVVSLTANALQ